MAESLFINLFYNNSTRWAETGQRDGDSLACFSFQHAHTGKHGNHPVKPPDHTVGSMAALFPGTFLPQDWKPGLAAWAEHQTQGQAGVPESAGALIPPEQFSCNVSDFGVSSVTGDNITFLSLN